MSPNLLTVSISSDYLKMKVEQVIYTSSEKINMLNILTSWWLSRCEEAGVISLYTLDICGILWFNYKWIDLLKNNNFLREEMWALNNFINFRIKSRWNIKEQVQNKGSK